MNDPREIIWLVAFGCVLIPVVILAVEVLALLLRRLP
jgi:hypothetical protein